MRQWERIHLRLVPNMTHGSRHKHPQPEIVALNNPPSTRGIGLTFKRFLALLIWWGVNWSNEVSTSACDCERLEKSISNLAHRRRIRPGVEDYAEKPQP